MCMFDKINKEKMGKYICSTYSSVINYLNALFFINSNIY